MLLLLETDTGNTYKNERVLIPAELHLWKQRVEVMVWMLFECNSHTYVLLTE